MTPDRLVDFIPTVLDWLHPQPMPEIAGDTVGICGWYQKLCDHSSPQNSPQNGTIVPARFPEAFWPAAPKINTTEYALSRAMTAPQLSAAAGAPVHFCNYAGHNAQGDPLPALQQCQRISGHVIASNGELAFFRDDFTLPGPFSFYWRRYYRQSQEEDLGLGPGWRHTLNEHLQLPEATPGSEQKVLLHSADGRLVAFNLPAIGHASFNRSERLYLLRQSLHSFRISAFDAPDKIFRATGTGKSAPLCELRDGFGNTLSVDYHDGRPKKIVSSWGTTIDCHYEDGRLIRLTNTSTEDGGALCNYIYDSEGFLVASRTASGEESFTLETGRIAALTNLNIGHLDFTYDKLQRVSEIHRSEEAALCAEAGNDSRISWQLRWRSGTHSCIVSSTGQHDLEFRFDSCGNRIESSQGGRSQRWRYDLYRNLCHSVDSHGADTLYRHDQFGRILRRTRNGVHNHYIYDDTGRLVVAGTVTDDANTRCWQYQYAETARHPSAIIDPEKGLWKCEYDERGQLRVLTDPQGGRLALDWNAQCRLVQLAHGDRLFTWDYESRGKVVRQTATGQPAREWHYDKHGNVIGAIVGTHTLDVASDEYNRPCTVSCNGEVLLQWQYDGHGQIRYIQELTGPTIRLDYNAQGRLSSLRCNDHLYSWRYDSFGQLTNFDDGCALQQEWQYESSGRLREFRDGDSHWYLEYNDTGQLQHIRNNSGQLCRFHFDALGRLTQAANEFCSLRFRYDKRDLLTAEHHDLNGEHSVDNDSTNLSINHRYDSRGWLRNSCSDRINIALTFSPAGTLYGIDTNGVMSVRSETHAINQRDETSEYRECLSLGSTQIEKIYAHGLLDSTSIGGDLLWRRPQSVKAAHAHLPRLALFAPHPATPAWERDAHQNIIADTRTSPSSNTGYRYQYDGWGLLHCIECGDFKTWLRCDPFGRRLMKTSTHRRSGRQRRITTHWSGTGLWSEVTHLNESHTTTHFLHHPTNGIALARLTIGEHDNISSVPDAESMHREFFVANDEGELLALLADTAEADGASANTEPLWYFEPKTTPDNDVLPLCPGSFQGSRGIYDSEVQLFYRNFRHLIPKLVRSEGKIHMMPAVPLEGGLCNLTAAASGTAPGTSEPTAGPEKMPTPMGELQK